MKTWEREENSQLLHTRRCRAVRSDSHVETAFDWYRWQDLVVGLRKIEKTTAALGKVEEGWRSVFRADGLEGGGERKEEIRSARPPTLPRL